MRRSRQMSLTPDLVARCFRIEPELPDPQGWLRLPEARQDRIADRLDEESAGEELWIFAYGSLIWNPGFAAVDRRRATALGWHRSFCMELTSWRGTPEQPGLMMALDRGGRCEGVALRLSDETRRFDLRRLVRREIVFEEDLGMVRWISVRTELGPLRALVFWAGPKGEGISLKLPLERVAWILARACGHAGSGAEYLHNTVSHLEDLGVRDRNLWRLQALVADEILRAHPVANAADPARTPPSP